MDVLRTPDECFASVADWPHEPGYVEVDRGDGSGLLRMATYATGPADGPAVLLLHGEPSWSYLYRTVAEVLAAAGCRTVLVDLVGFGRSDKPAAVADHSYARHVEWVRAAVFDVLGLRDITLVGQDWGGLIGLRLLAEHPDRFARAVAANTGLPTGEASMPEAWWAFRRVMESAAQIEVSRFVAAGCARGLGAAARAAYNAPFPDARYQAGPRAMPLLVPTQPDDPASLANRDAWTRLSGWNRPFLVAFSDGDPITGPMAPVFQRVVPGAAGVEHPVIADAGHFLQEDAGAELGAAIAGFIRDTPGPGSR